MTDSSKNQHEHDPLVGGDLFASHELVLDKNGQRYVFRYRTGEERKLLEGLMAMVRDPDSDLQWFDAARVSHQMGDKMGRKLKQLLKTRQRCE
jgi:hypothetical protein